MAVESIAEPKKMRKRAASKDPPPSLAASHNPPKPGGDIAHTPEAPIDPRFLMTRLESGKSRHEYCTNEAVFSQGDAANSVFYIQSGKVKLTVVSKVGKEAVIAILPEDSFFGEGCLAGQPLRMATVRTVEPSTIIRVE